MPRVKQKTKEDNLTRVRNNQRRCRQRKRDYVSELERRLASIEDTTSREIRRLQSITDELRQDNERLTALLYAGGADSSFIRPNRQTESENNALRDMTSDLVPFGDRPLLGPTESTILEDIPQFGFDPPVSISPNKLKDFLQDTSCLPTLPEIEPDSESLLLPEQDVIDTTLSTNVSRNEYQDTTVCAVALELVMNYNTKNLSISELDMRLRCGYRSARFQWEGCRVDNQVLFAVLAEVTR
ncbi:hypothetical protein BDV38DRAFT_279768 [Aspergillus pseudotamarii]|uniref:BZIP domain-containing protein n=1 Tax=Aspergillus pseudotamarii TaxID=132259 RepID=A0A5N6T3C7_ASPPS|nr:uncharacterized protein BDV38DRAFT_279768 [Aspergillus pseudotamarii]KAE8140797.1 hypothetical protein BDV38DRAFT_279768 [Aspergillus pseudotamarii]